jgi:uncharacterized membrane protein
MMETTKSTKKPTPRALAKLEKILPWLLIICGTIGLAAAAIIMIEKVHLLQDPGFRPGCDLNPVISCGSVMESKQANAFGFPNPIIGLAAFPVLITTGVVMLTGFKPKRWYMIGLQLGTIFGLGFVHWLFFQSVYRINALCPYCMAVWAVTITSFWYVLQYNLRMKYIVLKGVWTTFGDFLQKHHLDILILWFLVIFVLIMKHFWYYYGPRIGF